MRVNLMCASQDVLLETVAGPVRLYLQGRKDTVRCIVASLTDETSGDLYDELRRQASRHVGARFYWFDWICLFGRRARNGHNDALFCLIVLD